MIHLHVEFTKKGKMETQNERVLILTLSGGGGHLQAARAKRLELERGGCSYIIEKDTIIDFLGKNIGGLILGAWNYCQRHGRISSTFFFSICSHIIDSLITPLFLIKILILLKKDRINRIIDTQHIGTKAVIKVIRILKYFTAKTIIYEKILTDLPTKQCRHYFKSFQKLSTKDKTYIKVTTTAPLLEEYNNEKEFWKQTTGLDLTNITYGKFPLRPTFNSYKKTSAPLCVTFNTYTPIDTINIEKCLAFGNTALTVENNTLTYTANGETLSLITLGSYPEKALLVDYMLAFIQQKEKFCADRKDLLFLLIGSQKTSAEYYTSIILKLSALKQYPKNLTIVPIPFQDDTVLAPLYFHINFIIAKSGGLTTMELLQSVTTNIFIHDSKPLQIRGITIDLMPPWERGNARYLMQKKKAQMITPELFNTVTSEFFLHPSNAPALSVK